MSFKEKLVQELKEQIPESKLGFLPKGFQRVGDIVILNLNNELDSFKEEIGEAVLRVFPKIKSVCNKEGEITGQFREPQIKVIAGSEDTKTCHKESGCVFCFDVQKVMFAKGNVSERTRIAKQVKSGEIIVDMFAGIGYFSVPIARTRFPDKVYSIELNTKSFEFLKENIEKNKILDIVEPLNKNSKEVVSELFEKYGRFADRVLLGYLPPPIDFVPYALKIIKSKGIIHYEALINTEHKEKDIDLVMKEISGFAEEKGLKTELILAKKVKGYGPKKDHYVLDVRVL